MNSTLNNFINYFFQSKKFAASCLMSLITGFSLIAAAMTRRFAKPAMFMLLLLMILPLAMVNQIQAQEPQSVSGEPELSFDLTPKNENITRPKTENIISSKIKRV